MLKKTLLGAVLLGMAVAVYIPSHLARNVASPESGAIGDLRSLASAEVAYASDNNGAYGRLECLVSPKSCGFPPETSNYLDPAFVSLPTRNGYARSFLAGAPGKGKPDAGIRGFVMVATPVKPRDGSRRGFAVDHTGRICVTPDGSPPAIANGALAPTCTELR